MATPRSEKTIAECTVNDLMDELTSRCPAIVMALLIPDDNDECTTVTMVEGNRMSALGLSNLLHEVTMGKMLKHIQPYTPPETAEEVDNDGDESTGG